MVETIKENNSSTHKEFQKLLNEDLSSRKFSEGEIATATISEIGKKYVFVDLGLKSEGAIPIDEFKFSKEISSIKKGDNIEVLLEKIENFKGDVDTSMDLAKEEVLSFKS